MFFAMLDRRKSLVAEAGWLICAIVDANAANFHKTREGLS
jgi:hypothetical protein